MNDLNQGSLVEENCIFLEAEVETFEEVIQLIGEQFIKNGIAKATYTEAVIQREKIYPTGLPGNGYNIAIPHTDSEHILRPSVGVIVTKKPIEVSMMGSPELKLDCQLFFPLAMEHPKKQLALLRQLMGFFQAKENLTNIYQAKSKAEVLDVVKNITYD
ncbi:PTS sugar transporter subunit IIA [Enterococcus rivorum]|uniref:PTS sugar transporter subunit IIA n=1 Tax=Enterococcus rivorum TaxID=762845 RepID=UPI001FE224AA|nr:PTS sugar transporter subunit IIA [Enterococcus rivorum]MBP2100567.1 PTS system galactitol-specific IIA component [Enterococcus rivorum]